MRVYMSLELTGGALRFENVTNAYTKGPLYCIMTHNEDHSVTTIHKFPLANIHSICEVSPSDETVLIASGYEDDDVGNDPKKSRKKKKKKGKKNGK